MNPSTALATVLVDELVRCGVTEAVLSPGSRSAPLALALHTAEAGGRLRLHVRVDERSAGFLALGLAKGGAGPVPVVCTSGTAAANLHPAVLEASASGVPLLLLTADRPPELRGTGANQTVDQVGLYGTAVRLFHEVGAPEMRMGQVAYWRSLAARACTVARGALSGDPGPVHLNVALREPLVPDGDDTWVEPLDGRPEGRAWSRPTSWWRPCAPYAGSPRTLVVVGTTDGADGLAGAAARLAARRGWPLVAEPVSGVRGQALDAGGLLLGSTAWLARNRPERVLLVGRPTLGRPVGALLRHPDVRVDVVGSAPVWFDVGAVAETVAPAALLGGPDVVPDGATRTTGAVQREVPGDPAFLAAWQEADRRAVAAAGEWRDAQDVLTGVHVAAEVLRSLPTGDVDPLLVLGSSSPPRDADLATGAWPLQVPVVANRGAAGIDGTVSTAVGAASARQALARRAGLAAPPVLALLGDLTFLHDANGLLLGPDEPRPDLVLVVVNDDGGAIFSHLEQGTPEHAAGFERVFATPTGADLAALCAASGTPHVRVADAVALRRALAPRAGLRVVEVTLSRAGARERYRTLRATVAAALD